MDICCMVVEIWFGHIFADVADLQLKSGVNFQLSGSKSYQYMPKVPTSTPPMIVNPKQT
jgi:hypothetical protein